MNITLDIVQLVLDFFHHLEFWGLENTTFGKLDLFTSSGVGGPVVEIRSV
jgi:hypothetical protein